MVISLEGSPPIAWPRARAEYEKEPDFHEKRASQHRVDLPALHAVASQIQNKFANALGMYCAGRPDLARGYLLRAECVYDIYGKQENYDLVPSHRPDAALNNRGRARVLAAWIKFALYGRWEENLLRDGLRDLHDYLMVQAYDRTSAYVHEDENRLFTVLCQMALGQFDLASTWLKLYINHRKERKLKENFSELLVGIQEQLKRGRETAAEELVAYFDQNRLGNYKFVESQSFWLCVPIAALLQYIDVKWQRMPAWDEILERLLY